MNARRNDYILPPPRLTFPRFLPHSLPFSSCAFARVRLSTSTLFSLVFPEKGSTVSRLQSIACTPSLHLCVCL